MALELTVVDDVDPSPGTVRLPREPMRHLGVSPGDAVTVTGSRRTAARVGDPLDSSAGLAVAADVRANAGLDTGERATVSATTPADADTVTVAPPRSLRFEGTDGAVERLLRGRVVTRGDELHASLFGGSLDVTFTVLDVEPDSPGLVTDATSIEVTDAPTHRPTARAPEPEHTVTYDDVAGLDPELRRLRRLVEVPLERPEVYDRLGWQLPTGVLVSGPAGVGKTHLVDAVGEEVDARYLRVGDPTAVEELYEEGFASLAERATAEAPAMVFVDDLDVVAAAADGDRTRDPPTEVRSFVDGVADENVVVVGATTSPDDIDPSLRRGGRFDHEVELHTPDRDDRLAILRTHAADVRLAADVDLESVADRTHGFVAADLLTLVGAAVQHAVGRLPGPVQFGAVDVPDGFAVTARDFEAALEGTNPGGLQKGAIDSPDVSYDDIGGATAAKREVIQAVEWPLRYPELFDHLASDPPTGILLHGLPGTGKTMLARAVANATDANFLAVNGPELLDRYVGESERAVREVFDRARQHAPTVVFFDELDALAPARGDGSDGDVVERVVSQLLTELDGVEPSEEVVIVGATNRPDMIDRALLRPGRLERIVEVPLPDREARREIFEVHARDIPGEGIDFERLADMTSGYTGSDVAAVVRKAGLRAMEGYLSDRSFERPREADLSGLRVQQSDFERAVEDVDRSVTKRMREQYAERVEELTG